MARRDDLAKLRSLAGELGYRLERAPARGCWFLMHEATGKAAVSERGTTAFGVVRALTFLTKKQRGGSR